MIELDTTREGLTTINLSKMEHALREVEEGIQHFTDRYNLGDPTINWMSLHRLKAHANHVRYELECFKKTLGTQNTQTAKHLNEG
jgi:CHAD domain-containing protein